MAALRKQGTVTVPAECPYGHYLQVDITDAEIIGNLTNTGDILVYKADGTTLVPHKVLHWDLAGNWIRLSLSLPSPNVLNSTVTFIFEAEALGRVESNPSDYGGGPYATGASIGPTIQVRTSTDAAYWNDGATMDSWVHPNVLKVPDGSWMKFKDATERDAASGTVTHIRIDTPYPDLTEALENPYLLYSTDNGDTWAEWHGSLNPIAGAPAEGHHSDTDFLIKSNGDLYCIYRWSKSSSNDAANVNLKTRVVTGTCLADATAAAEVTPTIPNIPWLSPSIVEKDGTWYVFVVDRINTTYDPSATTNFVHCVYRWSSTDEGATWVDDGLVIKSTEHPDSTGHDYGATVGTWWHGAVKGPFADGWYYGVFSEPRSTFARLRLFRSKDLTSWEASRHILIKNETGTISESRLYTGCVYERSDGAFSLFYSGRQSETTDFKVSRTQNTPVSSLATLTHLQAFGWSILTDAGTDYDTYDSGTGQTNVITLTAVDGTGTVEYQLEILPAGGAWTLLMDWAEGTDIGAGLRRYASGQWEDYPPGETAIRIRARDAAEPTDVSDWVTRYFVVEGDTSSFLGNTQIGFGFGAWAPRPLS